MTSHDQSKTDALPLRTMLRDLFWDHDFEALDWESDRDLVVSRILVSGSWQAVTWLRSRLGDQALREWLERCDGDGLSSRQLRFWELILDLPRQQVNRWLNDEARRTWEGRVAR